MTDTTTEFFNQLEARGHQPALEKATGTLRFDLTDGKRKTRWLVAIERGDVAVSHRNAKADCVARADKRMFDAIVGGEQNAVAAMLRGELSVEGDRELMVLFQRLFPGPPRRGS
jgi:putative sterol carrier protein